MIKTLINNISQMWGGNGWTIHVLLVFVATFIVSIVETGVYHFLHARLVKTKSKWDDSFLYALHRPLSVFIWAMGFLCALMIAAFYLKNDLLIAVLPIAKTLTFSVALLWFFLRYISEVEKNISARSGETLVDKTTTHALAQILRVVVIVITGLIVMQTFNIPISGILAFGGIGGAAIAFSSKDLLANFFGGIIIFLDRPFAVGDWIRSPDRNIEGTVEQIGWRLTRIRTFDKRPLYVPNGLFSNVVIENATRMENRRIKTLLGVRYQDANKVASIVDDIERMLRSHPEIDPDKTIIVNLVEFGPSSLNIMIYCFTKNTEWIRFQAIQQDVFLKILEVVDQHSAQCAFPTTTLNIPEKVEIA